jgi:hypothetical protein
MKDFTSCHSKPPISFLSLPRELRHQILFEAYDQTVVLPVEKWSKNLYYRSFPCRYRGWLYCLAYEGHKIWLQNQFANLRVALKHRKLRRNIRTLFTFCSNRETVELENVWEDVKWAESKLAARAKAF